MFNRRILLSVGTSVALIAVAITGGALWRERSAGAEKATVTTTTEPPTTSTEPPTTTTTTPVGEANPVAIELPALNGATLSRGKRGPEVQAYEQRLNDLRFDPGTVDEVFDQSTVFAVQTLQKVMGFERNGVIGEEERLALNTFKWPAPLVTDKAEPRRFEVDIEKQTGTLYVDNKIKLMTTISSGAGNYYCWVPKTGGTRICEYGDTPSGRYTFYLKYQGWQDGDLGRIYRPTYFNGGIAVHGYPQVPVQAASHGCVRIPMYIAEYFQDLVETGDPVYVVGGSNGRRPVTRTPIPIDAVPAPAPTPTTPTPTSGGGTTTTTAAAPTTTTTAAPPTTTTAPPTPPTT